MSFLPFITYYLFNVQSSAYLCFVIESIKPLNLKQMKPYIEFNLVSFPHLTFHLDVNNQLMCAAKHGPLEGYYTVLNYGKVTDCTDNDITVDFSEKQCIATGISTWIDHTRTLAFYYN